MIPLFSSIVRRVIQFFPLMQKMNLLAAHFSRHGYLFCLFCHLTIAWNGPQIRSEGGTQCCDHDAVAQALDYHCPTTTIGDSDTARHVVYMTLRVLRRSTQGGESMVRGDRQ